MPWKWAALFCLLTCIPATAQAPPDDVPEANPGRPTVSTPATLTPVGYLQFENGMIFARKSPEFSTRLGVNQVTKLAVHPRVQLILLSEPLVNGKFQGQRASHEGEFFAGAQVVLYEGEKSRPTVAASYIYRLHASIAPDIDLGTFRQSAVILVSSDVQGFHIDANGMATEQLQGVLRRAQFGQSISISHRVGKFTLSGEVWHFSQPFLRGNAVGNLWGISYPLRKNLVADVGFNRGLTSTSTRWELMAGFTYVLPHRLWKSGASN